MLAKIHFSGRLEPIHGSPVVTACGRFGYYDKCGEMVTSLGWRLAITWDFKEVTCKSCKRINDADQSFI